MEVRSRSIRSAALWFVLLILLVLVVPACSDDDTDPACGDGTVQPPETCDDQNTNDCGDTCHDDCTTNTGCGDFQHGRSGSNEEDVCAQS